MLFLTIFLVFILYLFIFSSNAYYIDKRGIVLLHSKVGNIDYDYMLRIYVEDVDNSIGLGTYHLAYSIPLNDYVYNRYSCKNGSILEYDNVNNITNISLEHKDNCSIFFDYRGI